MCLTGMNFVGALFSLEKVDELRSACCLEDASGVLQNSGRKGVGGVEGDLEVNLRFQDEREQHVLGVGRRLGWRWNGMNGKCRKSLPLVDGVLARGGVHIVAILSNV